MGVIHKLTSEVIDYIVLQKKSNPKISCRTLSEEVAKKFKVNVSKSSISIVLQEADLNSPVGRRGGEEQESVVVSKKAKPEAKKPQVKFKIPDHRKKEIFKQEAIEDSNVQSVQSDKVSTTKMSKKEMSNQVSSQYLDRAGTIFIKALDWYLSGSSIVEQILKAENFGLNPIELRQVANLYSTFRFYGLKDISEVLQYQGQGLWLFSQLPNLSERQNILARASSLTAPALGLTADFEVKTLKLNMSTIRFNFEDAQSYIFDLGTRQLVQNNVQSEEGMPFSQGIKIAVDEFIKNVHSANFQYTQIPPKSEDFISYLGYLLGFVDRLSQGAKVGISCQDSKGSDLASYSPNGTRFKNFTLAVYSWAAVMPNLLAHSPLSSDRGVEQISACGRNIVYRVLEGQTALPQLKKEMAQTLTAIPLSLSVEEKPFVVLLIPACQDPQDVKKAVAAFLKSWPDIGLKEPLGVVSNGFGGNGGGEYQSCSETLTAGLINTQSLTEVSIKVGQILDLECQARIFGVKEHFVDEDMMIQRFYQMPGTWEMSEEYLIITLMPPLPFTENDLLKTAVNRLNQKVIFHPSGARLVVRLPAT